MRPASERVNLYETEELHQSWRRNIHEASLIMNHSSFNTTAADSDDTNQTHGLASLNWHYRLKSPTHTNKHYILKL